MNTGIGLSVLSFTAYDDEEVLLSICLAVSVSVVLSVGFLLGGHVHLVATNQLTVEYFSNALEASSALEEGREWRNPFDKGWRRNLRRVFGHRGPAMLLLPLAWFQWYVPRAPDYEDDVLVVLGGREGMQCTALPGDMA